MRKSRTALLAVIALVLAIASPASALTVTGTSIQSVSSELIQSFSRDADRIIDGSGLDINGPGTHSSDPDGTMWLNTGSCCGGFSYVNSPGPGLDDMPEVTIDLGATYDLNSIRIWNYNEINLPARGVEDVELLTSLDGVNFVSQGPAVTLAQAPGADNVDFSETFPMVGPARFVKLDIQSAQPGSDNNFFGLSEVRVDAAQQLTRQIAGVSIAGVSTEIGSGFDRDADYLVNGAGLGANEEHSIAPDGTMWLNNGTGFGGGDVDNDPFVVFNLGAPKELESIQIWNYNETLPNRPELLGRGVNELEILVGDTPTGPFTSLGVFNLGLAPGNTLFDYSEILHVSGFGQYVMFDILSNHNGAQYPNGLNNVDVNFVGLSEVRFFSVLPAVPEPATFTLLGVAGLAVLRRRRRA